MTTLPELRRDLERLVDKRAMDRLRRVGGDAGEKAALKAAAKDLGSDRAFSGMKRRIPLNATTELVGNTVRVNLSPRGLWDLASKGRRSSGRPIVAKGGALATPYGPRRSVRSSRSRGLGTVDEAEKQIETDAVKAIDSELTKRIGAF